MADRLTRLEVLCGQQPRVLTGIDFVQVVDPTTQTTLRVYFLIEPDSVTPPLATPVDLANPSNGALNVEASIAAVNGGSELEVLSKDWKQVQLDSLTRVCLEVVVAEPGGFEPYRLSLDHQPAGAAPDQLDPFSSTVVFDFKQACETGVDCRHEPGCPHDPGVDFPVDYLARDFGSLRRTLLDFTAQRYPDWREPIPADIGVMLLEIMAAMGDEFAYAQDRNDAETRFGSATQRASLFAHSRLVEYEPRRGRPARGEVVVQATAAGVVRRNAVVWAASRATSLVPFSIDDDLWVHPFWNSLMVHTPDPSQTCLAAGQISILLRGAPGPGATPADPSHPGNAQTVQDFLVGRRAMLRSDPVDASTPNRAWPVTVTSAEQLEDPLIPAGGPPTPLIRLGWATSEATPFDLLLDGLTFTLNVAAVTAGEPVTAYARAGTDQDVEGSHAALPEAVRQQLYQMPRLVERQGPYAAEQGNQRTIVARFGLAATETTSLRFDDAGRPALEVTELIAPAGGFPLTLPPDSVEVFDLFDDDVVPWEFERDLLDLQLDTRGFTVEPGMWRIVETHRIPLNEAKQLLTAPTFRVPVDELPFSDYAGNDGWTVKFGFGDLGEPPANGTLLRFRYFTDPGLDGNIASFAIAVSWPLGAAPDPLFTGLVSEVTNPLPFDNATAEETAGSIRLNAPQFYRERPRRAVRPEDYSVIIELLDFVQRAYSTTRWTGSWSTDFVAVDPVDSIAITDGQRRGLATEIDCIRLATRDARPIDPIYVDLDIEVLVCVAVGFYAGDVVERVRERLARPGLFAPDNFTFGDPLRRSTVEAAVQAVPGVAHVEAINVRVHGVGDWRPFDEAAIRTDPDEIIRLQDDPDRSTLGLLRVRATGVM